MAVNRKMYPTELTFEGEYIYVKSHFECKDEIKAMKGARWDPEKKIWKVANCRRNRVAFDYLSGSGCFKRYTLPLNLEVRTSRMANNGQIYNFYDHQIDLIRHGLIRRECIIAAEMGLGKSLCFFEIFEQSTIPEAWYAGPKSAIASVQLDAWFWRFRGKIRYFTYESLKSFLKNIPSGFVPPQMVCFDESSRVKSPTSQRAQASEHLANAIRDAHGDKAYVILMSGSPAPKDPGDWYQQCEIACPGFIKEGDIYKFRRRMAIYEQGSGLGGQTFQKLVAWKNGNPDLCGICGKAKDAFIHTNFEARNYHTFADMPDEVSALYKRLSGLVMVKLKKECLDLPAKIYRKIQIKPSMSLLRAAKLIKAQSRTSIEALTNLRQLADGFQYKKILTSDDICTNCIGSGSIYNDKKELVVCPICNGTASRIREQREVEEIKSPKLDVMTDLLEECEETGRIVCYAGFTASIDRLCNHVAEQGWNYIRVDGRGWTCTFGATSPVEMLKEFQNAESKYEKIAFIGHPGSAGMGITLTRSSMLVYLSNTFNAEERIQSEDRCHRLGMDMNRGCTIVDLILLASDELVLNNLQVKRDLLKMSMGDIDKAIDSQMGDEYAGVDTSYSTPTA